MNTTESNKLIAEFMGGEFKTIPQMFEMVLLTGNRIYTFVDKLKYHSSWNWLMPVVEKIENIQYKEDLFYDVIIGGFAECMVVDREGNIVIETIVGQSKIDAVYTAVIQFIKWYNENQK